MHILILGGTGSIGASVVSLLLSQGHEILAWRARKERPRGSASLAVRTCAGGRERGGALAARAPSALALEHAPSGSSYIGVATEGFTVGKIAPAIVQRHGAASQNPTGITADLAASLWGRLGARLCPGSALERGKGTARAWRTPQRLDPIAEIADCPI
jgi:NAD(P)-dependent dehydrogenase (short-subunit alcohol dehydrogenase family)